MYLSNAIVYVVCEMLIEIREKKIWNRTNSKWIMWNFGKFAIKWKIRESLEIFALSGKIPKWIFKIAPDTQKYKISSTWTRRRELERNKSTASRNENQRTNTNFLWIIKKFTFTSTSFFFNNYWFFHKTFYLFADIAWN